MKSITAFIKSRPVDELLLGALVFLLPFERIPSIDLFGISLRLSFIVAAVLIARATVSIVRNRFEVLRNDEAVQLLVAFVLWVLVTSAASINTTRAIQVATFTAFTIAAAVAIRELYRPSYLPAIINALLVSSAIVGVFGILQYFGNMAGLPDSITGIRSLYSWQIFGFPRIHSTALEPLYYCSYLLIPTAYLLMELFDKKKKDVKHVLLYVLLVTSIFISLSRGGIIAFIGMFIIGALLTTIRRRITIKNILAALALTAMAAVISLTIISLVSREPLNKTITNGEVGAVGYATQIKKTSLDGSGDDRGVMRNNAILILKEDNVRLVVGIGPGQFGPYIQDNTPAGDGGWKIVNNETLELLVEYGLIGFCLLLAFMVTVMIRAWKATGLDEGSRSLTTLALMSYMGALVIQYQTFSTLYIMHVWVVVGLLMALGSASNKARHGHK